MLLALVGLLGFWFSSPVPEERDFFKGKKIDCCPIFDKELCPFSVEDAYKRGCLNENERKHAQSNNFYISCINGKIGLACLCGCFDPSTRMQVWDTQVQAWKEATLEQIAQEETRYLVLTQTTEGEYAKSAFTIERCGPKPLLVFELSDGSTLKVTEEHPLWTGEDFWRADELEEGDGLIAANGQEVEILFISEEPGNAKGVMNLRLEGEAEHLFLSNGIWAGGANEQEGLE